MNTTQARWDGATDQVKDPLKGPQGAHVEGETWQKSISVNFLLLPIYSGISTALDWAQGPGLPIQICICSYN